MSPKSISFLGATGDSAGHTLAYALNAGHPCTALARTPSNLTTSLLAKGVSQETLDSHLTIIPGDVRDPTALRQALTVRGNPADTIVSGIGSRPTPQWSLREPFVNADAHICLDAADALLRALREMKPSGTARPLVINITTTGVPPAGKPWDVPALLSPLYRWLLHSAHEDKREMERVYRELEIGDRPIRGFVMVRASLLMDGDSCGLEKVRQGTDEKPAVGYTIRRKDVGLWVFENLLKGDAKPEWVDNGVTITY